MRKLSILAISVLSLGTYTWSFAQSQPEQKTEYEKQITKANGAVAAKKYLMALRALGKAKGEVDASLKTELKKALPDKSGEWVLSYSDKEEKNVTGSMVSSPDLFTYVRIYTKGAPKDDQPIRSDKPEVTPPDPNGPPVKVDTSPVYAKPVKEATRIIVTVSNYNEFVQAVERVYHPDESDPRKMVAVAQASKFNVKENRATLSYNRDSNYGDLFVSLGTNATVRIVGFNIDKPETLKTLAEAINYDILNKVLQ